MKVIFYLILGLIVIISCKNDNSQNYNQDVDYVNDTIPKDLIKTSLRIVGMPETEGVMTITEYIDGMDLFIKNTEEFKLITIADIKEERLFLHYFSGGAHCCQILLAFKYNSALDVYEFLDEFSYDGDGVELEYPFKVNYRLEYFYCSYADGENINCPGSNFERHLYLVNDKFEFKSTGNYNAMKRCLINYLQTVTIPELSDNSNLTHRSLMFDNGERETIVNFMLEMFTINYDIYAIQEIYMTYFPNVTDKFELWEEIYEILLKNGKITPTEQFVTALIKSRKDGGSAATENWQSMPNIIPTNKFNKNASEELPTDCDELLELIQSEGDRIQYLDDGDMNSDALYKVELYEYDGIYYVIIQFQSGSQEYIYCDINKSYWNRFVDNDDDSYGSGYHNWIRPNTSCGCGK